MSDDAAFLEAIQADPGDDTVRFVYADWLEERSDLRAEYLRLDCEISRLMRNKHAVAREVLDRHLDLQDEVDLNWAVIVTRVRHEPDIRPWFWRLLESSNRSIRTLSQKLEALPEERLRSYAYNFDAAKDYVNPCYREQYYPYLTEGCSEDHGDDVAAWIVMEGRDVFEGVLTHPDQINRCFQMYDDALRDWRRKRKRRGSASFWDTTDVRPEYQTARGDYLARAVYEVRFGREMKEL